jgi:hypothetical protein
VIDVPPGELLPSGARLFTFIDGYVCGHNFHAARANSLRFETPEAARMAWEMSDLPEKDLFSRIRVATDWIKNHETQTRTSLSQNLIITEEVYEDAMP